MAVLGGLRRRPLLAAALLYALLSIAFVSPALVPGKTLSASDYLWSVAPWAESRPADVDAVRLELRPARPGLPVPAGVAVRAPPPAGHPALEPAHHGRAHVHRELPVGAVLAVHGARVRVSGCGTRSRGWRPSSCSRPRSAMFLLGRALGMRFAGALLAGTIYGVRLLLRGLARLADRERVGLGAVALPARRHGRAKTGAGPVAGSPWSRRSSSSAAIPSRAST